MLSLGCLEGRPTVLGGDTVVVEDDDSECVGEQVVRGYELQTGVSRYRGTCDRRAG